MQVAACDLLPWVTYAVGRGHNRRYTLNYFRKEPPMDIIYESTEDFEKDLRSFTDKERARVVAKINLYCSLLPHDKAGFFRHAKRPIAPVLSSQSNSSLYALRVSPGIRVLATIDEDPLFDQYVITLLRVVRHEKLDRVYRGLAESIYQKDLLSFRPEESKNDGAD